MHLLYTCINHSQEGLKLFIHVLKIHQCKGPLTRYFPDLSPACHGLHKWMEFVAGVKQLRAVIVNKTVTDKCKEI